MKKAIKQIRDNIKIRIIKKQIKQNQNKENNSEKQISFDKLDSDIIYQLLQDEEIVKEFCNQGNLLYIVLSMNNKAKALDFLEKNIDLLNDSQSLEFIKYAKENISPEEFVNLNIGKRMIEQHLEDMYEYLGKIDLDGMEELFSKQYILNGATIPQIVKGNNIPDNIKRAILKTSEIGPNAESSLLENEVVNNDEYVSILKSRIPIERIEEAFKNYCNLENYDSLTQAAKVFENNFSCFIEDEKKAKMLSELYSNFDKEECKLLLEIARNQYTKDRIEMNFFNKTNYSPNILQNIIEKDGNLSEYKNYLEFRKEHTNLDFAENIVKTLAEYEKNSELYKDMTENISQQNPEDANKAFRNYHHLMQLDNKFEIKTFEELQKLDEIEKQYYKEQLETNDIDKIKASIYELLTPNSDIKKLLNLKESKEIIDDEDKKKNSVHEILDIVSVINEINSIEDLKNILSDFIELIGTKQLSDFRELSQNMEEQLVNEYRNEYVESLSHYEQLTNEEIAQMEGISLQMIDGVKVIELNGIPFNAITHFGNIGRDYRCCCSYITEEQYGTYNGALKTNLGAVYNEIEPSRIKYICAGDIGFSRYKPEYVTSENLVSMTENSDNGVEYNEIRLATERTESNYDNGTLQPSAFITTAKIGSEKFTQQLALMREKEPKVLYVINDEVYRKKQQQRDAQKEVYKRKYMDTLDITALNQLLLTVNGDYKRKDELIQVIASEVSNRIDEKIEKKVIQANIRRYEELVNYRGEPPKEISNCIEQLRKILSKKDNEIMSYKLNIKDEIKRITENNRGVENGAR